MTGKNRTPRSQRLIGFLVFWYGGAILLAALGLATLIAVHRGHRLAGFFVVLSAGCFVVASLIGRTRET